MTSNPFEEIICGAKPDKLAKAFESPLRVLWKVHGDVSDGAERVLTADEYQSGYAPHPRTRGLNQLLTNLLSVRTLLFVGCSLQEDRIVTILRDTFRISNRMHFAIVSLPDTVKATESRRRFLEELGLSIIWYPTGQHHFVEKILSALMGEPELAQVIRRYVENVISPQNAGK